MRMLCSPDCYITTQLKLIYSISTACAFFRGHGRYWCEDEFGESRIILCWLCLRLPCGLLSVWAWVCLCSCECACVLLVCFWGSLCFVCLCFLTLLTSRTDTWPVGDNNNVKKFMDDCKETANKDKTNTQTKQKKQRHHRNTHKQKRKNQGPNTAKQPGLAIIAHYLNHSSWGPLVLICSFLPSPRNEIIRD